ncbi:MAG: outer membrane protein transport protein, partial [Puniceicoccales bacterium]|nr:outer membrane protein transport protein [Puniceicoccales bacterium]
MSSSPATKRLRRLGAASFSAIAAAGAIAGGAFLGVADARAQGVIFRGMGAVNESMGGAGIATSLDSAGAIYTNPAALSGLPQNEVSFGLSALMPESSVESYATAAPALTRARSESKQTYYAPSFSVARHVDNWTFGCAVGAIGGASANYAPNGASPIPGVAKNPILGDYGKTSKVKIIELMPTASYKFRDWLYVGVTGVVGCFSLQVDPMPFGLSTAAPLYRSRTDYTFGGGFNVGVLVSLDRFLRKSLHGFKTGLTFKSPVWAEPFRFSGGSGSPTGAYEETKFKFTLPLVVGWGLSYTPPVLKGDLIFALDVRYIDYANTDGFKPSAVIENGRVAGLGWDSILSVAVGVQYRLAEDVTFRAGYCWSENPIPGDVQFANVSAPLFVQHVASVG